MKHESGTETVGRRKTLTVGHCALVLYWFDAMYPIMKMKWVYCLMLCLALCYYRPLPLHPSFIRSFHSLQVSWRWSWTADWCKTITGVWGRAWRTTNERPIASVFCWRGGAAVKRWVLTGRGYKWTKLKVRLWIRRCSFWLLTQEEIVNQPIMQIKIKLSWKFVIMICSNNN